MLHVVISSDDKEVISILTMVKDNTLITLLAPFTVNVTENPHFFGNYNPPLDNLLTPSDIELVKNEEYSPQISMYKNI